MAIERRRSDKDIEEKQVGFRNGGEEEPSWGGAAKIAQALNKLGDGGYATGGDVARNDNLGVDLG